jgi:hypothetical protein
VRFASRQIGFRLNVSKERHFQILLTEAHSAPISFRIDLFIRGDRFKRKSPRPKFQPFDVWRLLIHA